MSRARDRSQRFLWGALVAMASVLLIWAWDPRSRQLPPPDDHPSPSAPDSVDPAGGASDAGHPRAPARSARSTLPPPVSAAAPAGCPEDDEDPPGFVRPSVWDLLQLRIQELRDRLPQISRDASEPLREGLLGLNGASPEHAVRRIVEAPDDVRDGFDVGIAAHLHLGMRALSRGEPRTAWRHAREAAGLDPNDPLPHALASLAAGQLLDPENARREMRWAFDAAPDEPALALAYARLAAEQARFDDALAAVDGYVTSVPDDHRIATWRDRIAARRDLTSDHIRWSSGGIAVSHPEGALAPEQVHALVEVLLEALAEMAGMAGHPRRPELAVVVYEDRDAMRRATCAPSWSGGIFDGVLHLDVRAVRSAGWRRTARHEAAHAQLALVRGRLPHWLNEGLAQYLEGEPTVRARDAWRRMVRERFWIPFASLEGQLVVIENARDAELAYHQSLAMVRFLLDARGAESIGEAIHLVEQGQHEDLLDQLLSGRPSDGAAFLAFLGRDTPPASANARPP